MFGFKAKSQLMNDYQGDNKKNPKPLVTQA